MAQASDFARTAEEGLQPHLGRQHPHVCVQHLLRAPYDESDAEVLLRSDAAGMADCGFAGGGAGVLSTGEAAGGTGAVAGAKPIFKGAGCGEIFAGSPVGFNFSGNCGSAGVAFSAASFRSMGLRAAGTKFFSGSE